jgi:hypothetical protein
MSEWYDGEKKPKDNFHELLQGRVEKTNPRHAELTNDEKRRLEG